MANVLGALFGDIAEAIREKTGDTEKMKPAEFPEKISGISTGADVSGVTAAAEDVLEGKVFVDAQGNEVVGTLVVEKKSSDDTIWNDFEEVGSDSASGSLAGSGIIRYVTFKSYDGAISYGQKSVIAGDDCVDPVAGGYMDTPTRESDVQYDYTFAGWATEPGGGIDADALKNVTEDRTVYANFIAAVRYYNARFYSDGTLVATVPTAYGTQAVPPAIPAKEGYTLDGWDPSDLTVYGDMDFHAVWVELTGYYYITTLSDFPNTYIADLAINNAGTQVAIGMSGENSTPYVYDISGDTPVLKTHSNGSILSMQKVDFNYDETALFGYNAVYSSGAYTGYKSEVPISNGNYGTLTRNSLGANGTYNSSIMRCSPVGDVFAIGIPGNSSSEIMLNGIKNSLNGNNPADGGDFSPDGTLFAVGLRTTSTTPHKYGVRIYNVSDASLLRTVGSGSANVLGASFNQDGTMIAVIKNKSPFVEIYNVSTGELVHSFESILSEASAGCFVKGSNDLIVSDGSTIRIFDCSASEPQEIENHPVYQATGVPSFIRSNRSGTRVGIMSTESDTVEIWGKI